MPTVKLISPDRIAKLRAELEKDLEALNRVERLLAERNGHTPESQQLELESMPIAPINLRREIKLPTTDTTRHSLKELVIDGLQLAKEMGAWPRDIVNYCKGKGYQFTNPVSASASVSTALARMVQEGKVRKNDGRYYWRG